MTSGNADLKHEARSGTPDDPVWKQLLNMRSTSRSVALAVLILLGAELAMMTVVPWFCPEHVYLSLYLSDVEKEKTRLLLAGEDKHYIYDELLGWRNMPGCRDGKFRLDEYGARNTHEIGLEPGRVNRVLFLGSSLVNGAPHVENWETISAYIEDSLTESVNFGSMRHSLDQEYLAYKNRLYQFGANVVVVGLPGVPGEGLNNQYLPFRAQGAHGMPFLKPRFRFNSDELSLLPLPPKPLHEEYLTNSVLCRYLKETDDCYPEFGRFQRFGQMPVAGTIWYFSKRMRNLSRLIWGNRESVPILKALMRSMVVEGQSHDAAVVFLVLPDRLTAAPGGWRAYLPDHYAGLIAELRSEGFEVVDAREALLSSGRPLWELYHWDNYHYTSRGNQIIARSLKDTIGKYLRKSN
jgi:hypothetical protein